MTVRGGILSAPYIRESERGARAGGDGEGSGEWGRTLGGGFSTLKSQKDSSEHGKVNYEVFPLGS